MRVVDAVVFLVFAHASEQNCQSVFVDYQGNYSASEGVEVEGVAADLASSCV